jgi:hypothetical protein
MGYFMYTLPLWVIFCVILAVSLLAVELGFRFAQRLNRGEKGEGEGDAGGIVAALLGLLAFILAFSFSITTNRFDTRRQLVLDEANAISTTYLRARLIPQAQSASIRKLLEEYVDIRLKLIAEPSKIAELIARSEDIHSLLWSQAESMTNENMDSEIRSLFISSLNEVINLHKSRKTVALIYRIPAFIWLSLHLLMVASMFGTGYQVGASRARRPVAIPLMIAAFALVILMIAAMDRPGEKMFEVSQQPLIEVLEMMRKQQ